MFSSIVDSINSLLWGNGQVLIYFLLFAGLWFTWHLPGIQIRRFPHMFTLLRGSRHSNSSGISSLQALCTSLAARVGTGNLAGVAIAISLGGPGAIFWMWVIAFLGMATGFAESMLGQVYKVKDSEGHYRGGPAYYILQGLQLKWLAFLFSFCLLFGYVFVFSAVQANTMANAIQFSFDIPIANTAIVVTVLAGLVILGGLKSIARFSELVVPIVGLSYIVTAIGITLLNIEFLPQTLALILKSAFGLEEAASGTFAAALKQGIQRGLYSNEAGTGSVPQAAASAAPQPNHPASQGYIQMLGVFLDTIVICTCTAFIILLAGVPTNGETEGIKLTQIAMNSHIGEFGSHYITFAICLFAFTSIVANYAYAEANLRLFKFDTPLGRWLLTGLFLTSMFIGTGRELRQIWAAADMSFGLMAVINIIAIVLLTPTVKAVAKDYWAKSKQSKSMAFKAENCSIQGINEAGIW